MNNATAAKLIATALAVATLGLASTAQADDGQQGIAVGEPTPGQPIPAQTQGGDQGQQAPEAPDADADAANNEDNAKSEDDKLFERFQKECPNGEFSPGQFCKDYARGKYSKQGPTPQEKDRYERYCKMKDAEPSHSDKAFCKWYEDRYGNKGHGSGSGSKGHGSSPGTTSIDGTQPVAQKTEKADKGSLPFTGLEIWQLGLLGIVLVGGGFGARRLLAS